MQLSTTLLPGGGKTKSDQIAQEDLAVVIDVLRATSVMCTALQNGAKRVLTCSKVGTARAMADGEASTPLLCGERGCKRIEGFDLGNSPAEYQSEKVADRSLVLTTTNGTRAIEFAGQAGTLITASFLNLAAVADWLSDYTKIHFVCAGTDGEVTAEDVLLAGALVTLCETRFQAEVQDDDSILARQLWASWFSGGNPLDVSTGQLAIRLRETRGGRNLIRVGYDQDLERCAMIGSVTSVPLRSRNDPATFVNGSKSS